MPIVAIRHSPTFQLFSQVLIFTHHTHPSILYQSLHMIFAPLMPFPVIFLPRWRSIQLRMKMGHCTVIGIYEQELGSFDLYNLK